WGRTRKERERKKAEKGAGTQLDERLVLNDEGNVCIAEDYDGDIEEALARYDKALGYGTPRPRRAVLEEVVPPVVPDFARWKPTAVDIENSREEAGTGRDGGRSAEGGGVGTFGRADGGVGDLGRTEECAPLMPDAEGERANRQNEIGEAGGAIEASGEAPFGQGDGGVVDPCRTGERVPLMPDAEGERANQQNETGEPAAGGECLVARHEADRGCGMEAPKDCSPNQTAGGYRPGVVSKREKKRLREEMTSRELERRAGRKWKTDDATDPEKIKSVERLSPNVAKVLRQHHLGSP
ncbi:MAG TPA: hypothetical protein VG815_16135, partial [Chloroflexota bacterium]|nr:hypothetical protein [Chloroflexota bacterium]